jgi:hypothetical protein
MDKTPLDTSANKIDITVSLGKGVFGLIPFVGPLVAEIIGTIVPNQRIDRIVKFAHILEEKCSSLEEEILQTKLRNPSFVDLFEDGLYQAARALTEERLEHIALILKNGLSTTEVDYAKHKHILSLLSEINEIELLLLKYYSLHGKQRENFYLAHREVIISTSTRIKASIEAKERATIQKSYINHLVRLNLLDERLNAKAGTIKSQGYKTSSLGLMLLKNIDQIEP